MKVLGFIFLALVLVGGGIALAKAGLWDAFLAWVSSIFK